MGLGAQGGADGEGHGDSVENSEPELTGTEDCFGGSGPRNSLGDTSSPSRPSSSSAGEDISTEQR